MKECPYCGNPIVEEQVLCLKCGRQLQPFTCFVNLPQPLKIESDNYTTAIAILLILIILNCIVVFGPFLLRNL